MSDDLTLPEKIERLGEDANLLHAWTHGDETASVALGGVDTPSPRKMMHELDVRETAAAQAAIAAGVEAAGKSADAAAQSAQIASAGADVVTEHALSIELVAANIEAVQSASGNADAAAASAAAAAQSAALAEAASSGLAPRMTAVEDKNTQQDTRLAGVENGAVDLQSAIDDLTSVVSGKSDVSLSNVNATALEKIKATAKPVGYLATRTTTGLWTLTGLRPYAPLIILMQAWAADTGGATIRTQDATNIASTSVDMVMGVQAGIGRPIFCVLIPTAATVGLNVTALASAQLVAFQ